MKHQYCGIAEVSGCAILDQAPTAGIDRRLDRDLGKRGQVLRKKSGVDRREFSHLSLPRRELKPLGGLIRRTGAVAEAARQILRRIPQRACEVSIEIGTKPVRF